MLGFERHGRTAAGRAGAESSGAGLDGRVGGAKPRPISLWTRRLHPQIVPSFAYVEKVPQQPLTGSLGAMRAVKPHLIAIHKKYQF